MHTHNLHPSFPSQHRSSLTAPALTQGQNALDGSSPHSVLSGGFLWRLTTTSLHVNGNSPELLQWKANLETWDIQPSSQERLPNKGRGLPESFFKNRLDKKATELAEPEINKPAFGQGKAFKDILHSPLLSIICLGTLIFGIFLKPSLCAHTNLDDEPAERFRIGTSALKQESRWAGCVFSFSAASLFDLELLTSFCVCQNHTSI